MQCPLKYQRHSLQKQKTTTTTTLKLIRKHRGPQIAIATLKKENSVVVTSACNFKLCYRAAVTKTARYGHKTRLRSTTEKWELRNKPGSCGWFPIQVAKTKPNHQRKPHQNPHPCAPEKRQPPYQVALGKLGTSSRGTQLAPFSNHAQKPTLRLKTWM